MPSDLKASIKGGVEALTSGAFLEICQARVLRFTKIMTGISEAQAETPIIPERPHIPSKPPRKKSLLEDSPVDMPVRIANQNADDRT